MESLNISAVIDDAEEFLQVSEIPLYHWNELEALPSREYLIKGLLDKNAFSVIYGASNTGKSFVALDIAFHVAAGRDWCGQRTKQGRVVYIAGEGGIGIRERLATLKLHYGLDQEPDIYIIPTSVTLCGQDSKHQALIDQISKIDNIQLIIIDTLARAMAGDENSTKDMGEFIRNCDTIRNKTGAHILLVHHSGKDESKGARGAYALKCAIDTEIHIIKKGDIISAIVKKQREGKVGISYNFKLKVYPLGLDEDGEPKTSCVIEAINTSMISQAKISSKCQNKLEIIKDCIRDKGKMRQLKAGLREENCITKDECRGALRLANISKSEKPDNIRRGIDKALDDLQKQGLVSTCGEYYWITEQTEQHGTKNIVPCKDPDGTEHSL